MYLFVALIYHLDIVMEGYFLISSPGNWIVLLLVLSSLTLSCQDFIMYSKLFCFTVRICLLMLEPFFPPFKMSFFKRNFKWSRVGKHV